MTYKITGSTGSTSALSILAGCNVIWLRWMVFVTEVKETSSRTDLNGIEFSSQTHILVMVGNLSNDGTAAGLLLDARNRALW